MQRSMKLLLWLIIIIALISITSCIINYIDIKYFDGFWTYMWTKPRRADSLYWISLKPEYMKYSVIFSKYLRIANNIFSIGFMVALLTSIVLPILWRIKASRYNK